jgi:hypothetical protein
MSDAGTAFQEDHSLDIPSLAETMKLVPGVTLREGEITKRGPLLEMDETAQNMKHPGKKVGPKLDELKAPLSPIPEDSGSSVLESIIKNIHPVIRVRGNNSQYE